MKKVEETCTDATCKRTICKCIETKTPIKIDVSAALGDTEITCGRPRICHCRCNKVSRKGCVEFTVHQCLMVEIPISYNVVVDAGEPSSECELLEGTSI